MKFGINAWRFLLTLFSALWLAGGALLGLPASPANTVTCFQFMAPKKNVNGQMVGQEECLMQDHGIVEPSRKYRRVEIGVTGTVFGWIVKEGARSNHFTSAAGFLFHAAGQP